VRFARPDLYIHGKLSLSRLTFDNVPHELFKLSHYGLPDIPLRPVTQSSTFSYRNPLMWGSLIVAVVSFTLLRVMRAKADKSSTSVAT
jgi:hypothetical protein